MRVPKKVHQIWLQGGSLPDHIVAFVTGTQEICKLAGWEYNLWTAARNGLSDASLALFKKLSAECCCVSQQSNVLRYMILRDIGGLYIDTDVEVFRLPGELEGPWIVSLASKKKNSSYACASPQGDSWIKNIVSQCTIIDLKQHASAGHILMTANSGTANVWPIGTWQRWQRRGGILGDHKCLGLKHGHFSEKPILIT
jgi:mannosyltransferase OCH1-like enzyme